MHQLPSYCWAFSWCLTRAWRNYADFAGNYGSPHQSARRLLGIVHCFEFSSVLRKNLAPIDLVLNDLLYELLMWSWLERKDLRNICILDLTALWACLLFCIHSSPTNCYIVVFLITLIYCSINCLYMWVLRSLGIPNVYLEQLFVSGGAWCLLTLQLL